MTVLDHIDGIKVPGDVFRAPVNEYWALVFLRKGLDFINRQVAMCNELVRRRLNPEGKLKGVFMGNDPAFAGVPKGLLTCSFHWYAVTACQYVRTVGVIALKHDSNRPLPRQYVKKVIPEVLAFRDKVAAHFAWTTDNTQDSKAERQVSIMPPLTFVDDAFHVGAMRLTVRASEKVSDSRDIRAWSITGIHQRLCERYWPASEENA